MKISLNLMIKMHKLCDHEMNYFLCRVLEDVHNLKRRVLIIAASVEYVTLLFVLFRSL